MAKKKQSTGPFVWANNKQDIPAFTCPLTPEERASLAFARALGTAGAPGPRCAAEKLVAWNDPDFDYCGPTCGYISFNEVMRRYDAGVLGEIEKDKKP